MKIDVAQAAAVPGGHLLDSGLGLDAVVTSQLVPVPEDGVARLTGGQFLEGTLWGITGHLSILLLLEHTHKQANK